MSDPASPRGWRVLEAAAPFAAGSLLLGCGGTALANGLSADPWLPSPLGPVPLVCGLMLAGAGAAVLLSSWEVRAQRRAAAEGRAQAARAHAKLDLALRQARRLRAQADGLALMREIHRTTTLPDRSDRLQRILGHVAGLFEAREVTLFEAREPGTQKTSGRAVPPSAAAPARPAEGLPVLPVACLYTGYQDEAFAVFEGDAAERWLLQPARRTSGRPHVKDTVLTTVGEWLYLEGHLMAGATKLARVQGRRPLANPSPDAAPLAPETVLDAMLARVDFGLTACHQAAAALEERRSLRLRERFAPTAEGGDEETLLLCVPLLADQRPIGALRIRRAAEGFDGPAAEALEEMLIESAKHIALAMKKDQDDLKAITDQLTGLFIKRHLLDTLERLHALADEEGAGFALILVDLDHFKQVNDRHGHLSGDLVLAGVARILRSGLRAGDLAFRYGGEELVVLMPGAHAKAAEQLAERLRLAVQRSAFTGEKNQTIPVTISLGVAAYKPGLTGEQVLSRADRALYHSKHAGRNRATAWRADLPEALSPQRETAATAPAGRR